MRGPRTDQAAAGPVTRTRHWTRREYDRMIAVGLLHEDEKIELLAGRLVVAEPQNTPHATAIGLATEALRRAFGSGWWIRVQLPIAVDPDSEPEPDVTVVPGSPRDYLGDHPSNPALVVEVADWSVRLDRGLKAQLYARAGLGDYWIVNLVDRLVEIHREPVSTRRGRWKYRATHVARPGETLTPLAAPDTPIAVADLLP